MNKTRLIDIACTIGITLIVLYILAFTGIMKPIGFNSYLATADKDLETEVLSMWLCP